MKERLQKYFQMFANTYCRYTETLNKIELPIFLTTGVVITKESDKRKNSFSEESKELSDKVEF